MKKRILKTIRPLYEYIKTKPYLAHVILSSMGIYNDLISYKYNRKNFNKTIHRNCSNLLIDNTYDLDLVTIAFNNEKLIENQINFLKKNISDKFFFTVVDNSNNIDKSKSIQKICENNKVGYIRLPKNPWKQPNLSHSVALNWVYRNYIKTRNTKYFGFLDHDILPIKKTSVIEKFSDKKMYGLVQERSSRLLNIWYLWAGFCFYKNDFLKNKKVNFSSAIITTTKDMVELDTGGANWKNLYATIDKSNISSAKSHTDDDAQYIDDWIHLEKASFKDISQINNFLEKINK